MRVNYFAFGSNMNDDVIYGRRGIRPFASGRGKLDDYRLAFNLRGSGPEPAFAAVDPCPGSVVHGIVYSLALADWVRLCASEAAPLIYGTTAVRIKLYDAFDTACLAAAGADNVSDDATIEAATFVANPGPWKIARIEEEPVPSRRYMSLLCDGAKKGKLAPAWVSFLEDILARAPEPSESAASGIHSRKSTRR